MQTYMCAGQGGVDNETGKVHRDQIVYISLKLIACEQLGSMLEIQNQAPPRPTD